MLRRVAVTAVLAFMIAPRAPAEPPSVWFLNARRTGPDNVYLTVGGTRSTPPTAPDEVRLAWSWSGDSDEPLYPNTTLTRYLTPEHPGKKARPWILDGELTAFPTLGIGSGHELFLTATDHGEAQAWADLLDGIEAAYRQSMPDVAPEQRFEVLQIGIFGECIIQSWPLSPDETNPGWTAFDLPGHARPSRAGGFNYVDPAGVPESSDVKTIRVSRFLRWAEGPSSCLGKSTGQTLRLFPMPDTEAPAPRSDFFLSIRGVEIRKLDFFDLAPLPWTSAVRSGGPARQAELSAQAVPSAEQRSTAAAGQPFDLCKAQGTEKVCEADRKIRRRLYTWNSAGEPLPALGVRVTRACEAILTDKFLAGGETPHPCTDAGAWQRAPAGVYLADFAGDLVLNENPRIVSRLAEGELVQWLSETGPGTRVSFSLPDGTTVRLEFPGPDVPPDDVPHPGSGDAAGPWPSWLPYLAVILLLGVLVVVLVRKRVRPVREADSSLYRLLETEQDLPARTNHLEEQVRSDAEETSSELHARLDEYGKQLKSHEVTIAKLEDTIQSELMELRRQLRALSEKSEVCEATLARIETSSSTAPASAWDVFTQELEGLDAAERKRVDQTLLAASDLGRWIDLLRPLLDDLDHDLAAPAMPRNLPPPARKEWDRSYEAVRGFAARDAAVCRRPVPDADPKTVADLLQEAGWLDQSLPVGERLRRHLAPPDERGRLDEVTLALQYLLEAFPIEQLEAVERKSLRQELKERLEAARLPGDFHQLIEEAAAGLGLGYRAVRYYQTRISQEGFDFLEKAHSAISLSSRVGFSATTDPGMVVVVRLSRVFLFEEKTGEWVSGHACIAESS